MPLPSDRTQSALEPILRAAFQRLLEDAAELHRQGLLRSVPLRPGQSRPATKKLRIRAPR